MTRPSTPEDGHSSRSIEQQAKQPYSFVPPSDGGQRLNLDQILLRGADENNEPLEEIALQQQAPPLSEEELARQALEHPGADGDPDTPE